MRVFARRPLGRVFVGALLVIALLDLVTVAVGRQTLGTARDLELRALVSASALFAAIAIRLASGAVDTNSFTGWRWIGRAMLAVAATHAILMTSAVIDYPPAWTVVALIGGAVASACGVVGLIRLGARIRTAARLVNVLIDSAITGLSVLVITWVTILEQFVQPGDRPSTTLIVWAALGIGLGSVVLQQLSRVPRSWFGPLLLLVAAAIIAMVASIAGGELGVGYISATPVPSLLFVISFGLVGLAPAAVLGSRGRDLTEPWMIQRLLPYLAALGAIIAVLVRYVSGGYLDRPVSILGGIIAICVVLRQVVATVDERQHRIALVHEATHDFLTDLPNRMVLQQRLEEVLRRPPDPDRRHAVLLIDLDEFKSVNDGLSHQVGDRLLQAVSRRLRTSLRPTDTVARLGGDEFAILLENATREETTLVCERVGAELAEPFGFDGHNLRVTSSIGVGWSGTTDTPADLLRKADAAMYAAKRAGKGSWRMFDVGIQAEATDRLNTLQSIAGAVAAGHLQLVYQPIVDLTTRQVIAVEALLRWRHPILGWLSIAEAIGALEGTNLMTSIDTWVLEEAARQLQSWHDSGWDVQLHVNVSAREVDDRGFLGFLETQLEAHPAVRHRLTLEVTESAAYAASSSAQRLLDGVRDLGIAVAIDDFGTGYSALKRILDHRFDSLKIDSSFVADYLSPQGSAILEAISSMCNRIGLTVVAEGIETAAQAQQLRAWGFRYGQGFHFSPPLSSTQVEAQCRGVAEVVDPANLYWDPLPA
ncbi:MAG TPA: bifunctional diguanylate cyclase/phosphodiesterase [Candidatus Dormibacteraeota bacterium]